MKRIAVIVIAAYAAAAQAHDFWIEPSTYRPAVGQLVSTSLRVGQEFVGDPIPRSAQLFESFTIREAAGERAVIGMENRDPAGYVRIEKAGLAIIGYRSKANPLQLDAAKFAQFLKEEGLESVVAQPKPHRERFFRFAKSIIGSGGSGFDKPFGYRFEIIPETNPSAATPLRIRLVYEGKPLAGALVTAMHRDDPNVRLRIRSDKHGRVTLNLPKNGVWLIKSVQLVPAAAGTDAEWESLWASLTFER